VNNLVAHFTTDWSRLTTNDWIGLSATVIIFMLMAIAYAYTFSGKNRETLESHRFIIMNEDSSYKEDKNG